MEVEAVEVGAWRIGDQAAELGVVLVAVVDWNPVAESSTGKEERSGGLGDGSAGSELGGIGRKEGESKE